MKHSVKDIRTYPRKQLQFSVKELVAKAFQFSSCVRGTVFFREFKQRYLLLKFVKLSNNILKCRYYLKIKTFLSKVAMISMCTQTVLKAFPACTVHLPNHLHCKSYIFTILSKIDNLQSMTCRNLGQQLNKSCLLKF